MYLTKTVLAIVVARLDGKVPMTGSDKLEEMLLYTPTIFPLLFAALMGRFFDTSESGLQNAGPHSDASSNW